MPNPNYLTLWYQALAEPRGMKIKATPRRLVAQHLYAARAEAKDPELNSLSLVPSPVDEDEIWIVHNGQE